VTVIVYEPGVSPIQSGVLASRPWH